MAIKNKEQYFNSLRALKLNVYLFGEKIENPVDHPMIRPSLNAVGMTYQLAHDPQYKELMTAESHLTGKRINRFTHIHQSTEDLVKKVKMLRLLGQKTGVCFQRCVGMDAINSVYSTTFEVDAKYKTNYHKNFVSFLKRIQDDDLIIDGAMTDPKGDRSKMPHNQDDPDLFLRIVERKKDGVVVRGAKLHQTGAVNSHEFLVMPTISLSENDRDYAVSFAIPADAPGITMIYGRQSSDLRKMEENADIDLGNKKFSGQEAIVIFEDVFVPNDRIFLNGETEYAGMLVERFAGFHRQSYGGCKVGVGDTLIGATSLIAEYNGVEKTSHIKDKIVEMTHLNETLYACSIACSAEGKQTASGSFLIDLMLANVSKLNVTRFPYELTRIAEDIAGGLMVTLPSEIDFNHPRLGPLCDKYLSTKKDVLSENRRRIFRYIENLCLGSAAVGYRTESMHGAGSPQAMKIMIARQSNIKDKKDLAKSLSGINDDKNAFIEV